MKKLLYNEVKEAFESRGFKLLSSEYENSITKLDCLCVCGNSYKSTISNIKLGKKCKVCLNSYKRKYTNNFVEEYLLKYDYILISKNFTTTKKRLPCKCPCGNIVNIFFTQFLRGNRPRCCFLRESGNAVLDQKGVERELERDGYLLMDTYLNNQTPIQVRCSNGHIRKIRFSAFRKGHRCRDCFFDKKYKGWRNRTTEEREQNKDRDKKVKGYNLLKKKVKQKFKDTCVCCGHYASKNMRVHHLNSWAAFPEGRMDIDNLILLCPNCHDIQRVGGFHFVYGTGTNTKEQFIEYYNSIHKSYC